MAFYGLQWVPQLEQQIRPSEATPLERVALAHMIRTAGYQAAVEEVQRLGAQYGTDYLTFQENQQQMQSWKTYINGRLTGFTPQEAELVQGAAFAWRHLDPKFHDYYEKLSDNGKQLVEEYYQFLDVKETYDGAEARLWDLNERSTCLQKVVELWKFEATNAAAQQKRIKEELREEKRKKAELRKASKVYIAHVQQQKKRQRMKASAGTTTRDTKVPEQDELDSVLATLDNLAIGRTRQAPVKSSRKEPSGFLANWFTPKEVSPQDFLDNL